MTFPVDSATLAPNTRAQGGADALRAAARDLESVFMEQMFKAMRDTVPENGLTSGGSGEEMFDSLLDQHLAGEASAQRSSELVEAVYRQLRSRAGIQESAAELQAASQPINLPPDTPLR